MQPPAGVHPRPRGQTVLNTSTFPKFEDRGAPASFLQAPDRNVARRGGNFIALRAPDSLEENL